MLHVCLRHRSLCAVITVLLVCNLSIQISSTLIKVSFFLLVHLCQWVLLLASHVDILLLHAPLHEFFSMIPLAANTHGKSTLLSQRQPRRDNANEPIVFSLCYLRRQYVRTSRDARWVSGWSLIQFNGTRRISEARRCGNYVPSFRFGSKHCATGRKPRTFG